ncbi:MAG: hypothetical protein IPL39_05510 [Opitutaceae bacterium]|nr:hypothetical protein [Opitutaceae bacterium]
MKLHPLALLFAMSLLPTPACAEDPNWTVVEARLLSPESDAARNAETLLAWRVPRGTLLVPVTENQAATEAFLLVELPFDQAVPILRRAVAAYGRARESGRPEPLNELRLGWLELLVGCKPGLRREAAEQRLRPEFERAVNAGAFTAAEMDQRLAEAARAGEVMPEDLERAESLRGVSAPLFASVVPRSGGWFSRSKSELMVEAHDVSALFGRPATAIRICRTDTEPNPNYHPFEFKIYIFGAPSKIRLRDVVPGAVFQAVAEAFRKQGKLSSVASSPADWTPAPQPIESVLLPIDTAAPLVAPQRWDLTAEPQFFAGVVYLHSVLALPGGDLLVTGDVRPDEGGLGWRLWRLHSQGDSWRSEIVWGGYSGAQRLQLGPGGDAVWFTSREEAEPERCFLHRYSVSAGRTEAWPLSIPSRESDPLLQWEQNWILGADGLPVGSVRTYGDEGTCEMWRCSPPEAGNEAVVVERVATLLRVAFTKADLSPVRSGGGLWMSDDALVQIDPQTGHTKLSWLMPADCGNAAGPSPLGLPRGGAAAVIFAQELPTTADGLAAINGAEPSGDRVRFTGVHLIDLNTGRPRWSRVAQLANLKLIARSGGERWLAAGGGWRGPGSRQEPVQVLDAATGAVVVRLDTAAEGRAELRALSFAWSADALWAVGENHLWRWPLPAAFADPAGAGDATDQVQRE